MRVALDTNILVYAEGANGLERQEIARAHVGRWGDEHLVLPAQVCVELYRVLTRKVRQPPETARAQVRRWTARCSVAPTDDEVLQAAMDLVVVHRISILDAVIMATAASAGCDLLLT